MKNIMMVIVAVGTIVAALTGQYALCTLGVICLLGFENYDLRKKLAAVERKEG